MKFKTKPWKHQLEAVEYLMERDAGALYTDMGSGKTKIMIDLIVNRGWEKIIIVCPKIVCKVWVNEFTKHADTDGIQVTNLSDIPGNKKVTLIKENVLNRQITQHVLIVNYDSVWREPLRKFLLEKWNGDAVICDESHRIKSPSSKVSRFLALLGKRTPHRYLMTGTPLAQNPLDIYGQYRFLDPSLFGTNFGKFQDRYANMILMAGGFKIIDKYNPYKNLDELQEKMFSCAFKVDVELNLPAVQDIDYEFDLSPTAQKYYKQIKKEGVLELQEGYMAAANVLSVITRLQQVTSGYVPLTDEYGVTKITEIDTSRQEALKDLLDNIPLEEPVVIFCKYKKDLKNVRKIATAGTRSCSELSGNESSLSEWLAGKTNVLIVQISSGAEGIDLTRARYNIYYSMTHSLSQYKQSRKRTHRPGQTRPVVYYRLVAKMNKGKTIDEQIIQSLDNNQEIIDTIML